jgi:hypothetical protein
VKNRQQFKTNLLLEADQHQSKKEYQRKEKVYLLSQRNSVKASQ